MTDKDRLKKAYEHGKSVATYSMSSLSERYAPYTFDSWYEMFILNKANSFDKLDDVIIVDLVTEKQESLSITGKLSLELVIKENEVEQLKADYHEEVDLHHKDIKKNVEQQHENEQLKKDKERLDKLQSLTTGYGTGWILRKSSTDRGMRLHETSSGKANLDVREAIDNLKNK